MRDLLLEVCVDDADGLAAAIEGGADRIELCSALVLGGLTPSPGLMALAIESPVPVYVLIRPRPGDFVYSTDELSTMLADIDAVRNLGLDGVVLGASRPNGALDTVLLERLIAHASGLGLTLHRAFDMAPDFPEAVETAIELGFERILTSGGARLAPDGLETLHLVTARAAGRISIMPGSGVTVETAPRLLRELGVAELHASAARSIGPVAGRAMELGFEWAARKRTDAGLVAELKATMRAAR